MAISWTNTLKLKGSPPKWLFRGQTPLFFNQYSRNCFVPGVHIWSLLGPGQKLFELFAYYTLVPEGPGQKLFEIFELLIPQSLRDSPQGHFGPTRAGPKILRAFWLLIANLAKIREM